MNYLAIGFGAFCGAILRYELTRVSSMLWGSSLPGIALVNALGSFSFAFLAVFLQGLWPHTLLPSLLLLVGFLGSFTTFSTFSFDCITLLGKQAYTNALLYAGANVIGSVLLAGLGVYLARLYVK